MKFIRIKAKCTDTVMSIQDNYLINLDHVTTFNDDRYRANVLIINMIDGKSYETTDYTIDTLQKVLLCYDRDDIIEKILK